MTLVFILGSPRSGTTWLGKIFDSHPEVTYIHEPEIAAPPDLPNIPEPSTWKSLAPEMRTYVDAWSRMFLLRAAGTRPVFRKAGENNLLHLVRRAQVYAGKGAERAIPALGGGWTVRDPLGSSARLTVVKTVNLLGRSGLLLTAAPNAKAIYIYRHPCGQIASTLRGLKAEGALDKVTYSAIPGSPLGRRWGVTADQLAEMGPVERLAWQWAAFNDAAYTALAQDPRSVILNYEAMTAAPLDTARSLFAQFQIPWTGATETFLQASTQGSRQSSHYSLKRDPRHSAERWRKELDPADAALIQDVCRRTEIGRRSFDQEVGSPILATA